MHITPSSIENANIPENLEKIKNKLLENLRQLQPAPNVQMHYAPPAGRASDQSESDTLDADERFSRRSADARVEHGAEFYEGTGE